MKKHFRLVAFVTLAMPGWLLPGQEPAQRPVQSMGTESGFAVFQTKCMSCHGNPAMSGRVPDPATLRQLPPEKIYEALTTGPMKVQGQSLADGEKHGYAIMLEVEEATEGRVRMGPGTLYGSLDRMLKAGFITESSQRPASGDDDKRRRYYRLSQVGRRVLHAEAHRLARTVSLARAKKVLSPA